MAPEDGRGPRRALADSSRGRRNRYRSSMFRNRGHSCRNIHMVDIDGARSTISQEGHLNTITHMSVLSALEHWANRFHKKGNLIESEARSHTWMLDETGTINTGLLDHGEILQQELIDIRGV